MPDRSIPLYRVEPARASVGPVLSWTYAGSLDAALIVILWGATLAAMSPGTENPLVFPLLAASVWLAYTADRWLDARKAAVGSPVMEPHHRTIWRVRKGMALAWVLILATAILAAHMGLDGATLVSGWILAVCALVYTIQVQSASKPRGSGRRSLETGLFLAAAVAVFVHPRTPGLLACMLSLGVLFSINCQLVARMEGSSREENTLVHALPAILGLPTLGLLGRIYPPGWMWVFVSALACLQAVAIIAPVFRLGGLHGRFLYDMALVVPPSLFLLFR